ncbi:MAG: hypothetical protein Q7J32_06360, partial [Sphingomonadaceae bacterium]|nr:hypothetical protein [Sphingomonadaceae bacterium]
MPLRTVGGPALDLSLRSGLGTDVGVIGAILLLLVLFNLLATFLLWRALRRLQGQLGAATAIDAPVETARSDAGVGSPAREEVAGEREAFYRRASQASTDVIWEWRVGSGGIAWGDA